MEETHLQEEKEIIQKILDNHFEPERRFSIQDLDEDQVLLLIELLLEQDKLEREKIRITIEEQILDSQKKIDITYSEIEKIKALVDDEKINKEALSELPNLMKLDSDFETNLLNI